MRCDAKVVDLHRPNGYAEAVYPALGGANRDRGGMMVDQLPRLSVPRDGHPSDLERLFDDTAYRFARLAADAVELACEQALCSPVEAGVRVRHESTPDGIRTVATVDPDVPYGCIVYDDWHLPALPAAGF